MLDRLWEIRFPRPMEFLDQERRDKEFAILRTADTTDAAELFVRYLIVCSCGIALWFATDHWVMLGWAAGYCVINTFYVNFLTKERSTVSPKLLAAGLIGSTFLAGWFCAMVIYIASIKDGQLLLLSACGTIGLALHCLSRNDTFSFASLVDVVATLITGMGVAFFAATFAEEYWVGIAIVVGSICASGYFILSFRQIISERRRLNEKLQLEVQDQKMRALGQLTAGIAHDFNNLLTVIQGNIELAQIQINAVETKNLLTEAYDGADRGAALVQQLLAYARQSRLEAHDLELNKTIGELQTVLLRVIPSRITIEMISSQDKIHIHADQSMLESALLNLVINSRDAIATKPGTIKIEVSAPNETQAIVSVTDSGPGMRDDEITKAVEPFYSTKVIGEGSGLGLSMVKGFAEQSGGVLKLSNAATGGLIAQITLPRTKGFGIS